MIAGLSTCDENFPSLLWDRIVPQAQDSLNMLRTSRTHPQLSAYHVLEGAHDFNRIPWAPPGTRATIFNPPETRTSWGPRAINAWYIGPAPKHYRCYTTGGYNVWTTAFGKEFGSLAQGDDRTKTAGTDSMFILERHDIPNIPKDRTVTYTRVVVDYRPQKPDPNRVRITAGGNLISYPGEVTTRTADLTTSKILWNSVLSTLDAKYMCIDIKNFYLYAPLDRYEYMRFQLSFLPITSSSSTIYATKIKTGISMWNAVKQSTAYHRPEPYPTNYSKNDSDHTDTTKYPTHLVYGDISQDPSHLP
jgi:hypothetical protein